MCMYICILIRVYPIPSLPFFPPQLAQNLLPRCLQPKGPVPPHTLLLPCGTTRTEAVRSCESVRKTPTKTSRPCLTRCHWQLSENWDFFTLEKKNIPKKKSVFDNIVWFFLGNFLFMTETDQFWKKNTKPQIWTATAAHGVPWPYSGSHRKDRPRGCWTQFRGLGWRRKNAGSQILQPKIPIVEPTWRRTTMRRKKLSWGGGVTIGKPKISKSWTY